MTSIQDNRQSHRADWLVGLAVYGTAGAGSAGVLLAAFSFVAGRLEAAGTCLLAAGIAFGALANALLRN